MWSTANLLELLAAAVVAQWAFGRWRLERERAELLELVRRAKASPPPHIPGSSETRCARCSDPEFLHDASGCLQRSCRCLQYVPPPNQTGGTSA